MRRHSSASAPQPHVVPKVMVPRHSAETRSPLRPKRTKRMPPRLRADWSGVQSSSMPSGRTSSVELLLDLDRGAPIAAQLEARLREGVRERRLAPGSVLPSTRALARELGVSRGVVVAAYAQLGAEGYLDVRQGAAVRVARTAATPLEADEPPTPRPARYNLRPDVADYASFPRREWLASLRNALRDARDEELGYGDPRGSERLRVALAASLGRSRGVAARPARVHVAVGFAAALTAVCAALRARGARRIAIEDP